MSVLINEITDRVLLALAQQRASTPVAGAQPANARTVVAERHS
jgi:hypothetical protein